MLCGWVAVLYLGRRFWTSWACCLASQVAQQVLLLSSVVGGTRPFSGGRGPVRLCMVVVMAVALGVQLEDAHGLWCF